MNRYDALLAIRRRAADSPRLRRLLGKPPRRSELTALPNSNASAWMVDDEEIWPLLELYGGSYPLPPISYGTARDFTDSTENMAGLTGANSDAKVSILNGTNFDMKDIQRCWALKAILGNVESGSKILEIGAGEPIVAGILSRLGYDCTVVDPYDGSGHGPLEFDRFRAGYPDLRFVRDVFPPSEDLGGGYAAVYSISVLEHVPLEAIEAINSRARELLAERGGVSIHAVDHVLAGWSADTHLEKLERIVGTLGLSTEELQRTLAAMSDDPETYFVSAEAHNRWRGGLPYDDYPMRRIGSIQLLARA